MEAAGEAAGGQGAGAASNSSSSSSSGGSSSSAGEVQHRLAVLIPYRDRQEHLAALLTELRPYLERQRRTHDVFVVEQARRCLLPAATCRAACCRLRCLSPAALLAACCWAGGPTGQPAGDAAGHRQRCCLPAFRCPSADRWLTKHWLPLARLTAAAVGPPRCCPPPLPVCLQADGFLFNRGLLLNAAAQLLQGSSYDYYVFQVRYRAVPCSDRPALEGGRSRRAPALAVARRSLDIQPLPACQRCF
jgi:hypothetical protein